MISYTFSNNIRKYILGEGEGTDVDMDNNIDEFEITNFDYRKKF
ncbi:unnamed protein product [Debaryomyces fabryi]|nr:unnamed protein product [Debaryomyces fabryi]